MIEVSEAAKLIAANCLQPSIITMPLERAHGFALAVPPVSIIDTPPFNQSAMDGYCFAFDGTYGKALRIAGEVQAGGFFSERLETGSCLRIFTGAPVPSHADTVVMQENVERKDGFIHFKGEVPEKGSNVRLKGSQTSKGQKLMKERSLLTPAAVSFLAGAGISEVMVYSKPSVSLIVTGKELVRPGSLLTEGKIFESNSFGLAAALDQTGIRTSSVAFADDTDEEIFKAFTAARKSDIVIVTGGISVGDYDLVKSVLESCGVKTIFHKVRQKPGKPFYFGRLDEKMIFALPGNPAAVLSCFYIYIVPALEMITRRKYFRSLSLELSSDYDKKNELTLFLKGRTSGNSVEILTHQESYLLNTFSEADCIVELPQQKRMFEKGEPVKVRMIV